MILNLRLKCDLERCQHLSATETYDNLQSPCPFNLNGQTHCSRCKCEIPRVELSDHDCVHYLLGKIKRLETTNADALTKHNALTNGKLDTLENALHKNMNMLEKQAQQIAKLEHQNRPGVSEGSGLQSLSSEVKIFINCIRNTDEAQRIIKVQASDTIQNVCDQFRNQLGCGEKFHGVYCSDLNCNPLLNSSVKDNGIKNGYELWF